MCPCLSAHVYLFSELVRVYVCVCVCVCEPTALRPWSCARGHLGSSTCTPLPFYPVTEADPAVDCVILVMCHECGW